MRRMTQRQTQRRRARGMTLIEIMVVITILGLIAAAVGVAVMPQLAKSRQERASLDIKAIQQGLDLYKARKGKYPDTGSGLRALVQEQALKEMPVDPWGHDYVYMNDSGKPVIVSYGADGQSGGNDEDSDISSNAAPKA